MGKQKRKFDPDFKLKICREIDSGVKTRGDIMREHNLVESVIAKWLAKFKAQGSNAFTTNSSEIYHLKKHISALEKSLRRKALEVEILQETLKLADLKRGQHTNL